MKSRFSMGTNFIMLAIALVITLFTVFGIGHFNDRQNSTQPEEIKKALLDACVECYALEGSYPPSLKYLKEHYGVILDTEKYYYYYEVFASNILPDVEVYEK